jgi:radial spoke head protein 4A
MFTGDLNSIIQSYPAFPGNEGNYLRAQIARIASSTIVCPKGYYSIEDEDDSSEVVPSLQLNQDFEGIDSPDLLSLNNWVHFYPHILKQGRCTFYNPQKLEDEEEDENEKPNQSEVEVEEGPKLLSELIEDKSKVLFILILIFISNW